MDTDLGRRLPARLLPGALRRAACCRMAGALEAGSLSLFPGLLRNFVLTLSLLVRAKMMLQQGGVKIWRPRQVRFQQLSDDPDACRTSAWTDRVALRRCMSARAEEIMFLWMSERPSREPRIHLLL